MVSCYNVCLISSRAHRIQKRQWFRGRRVWLCWRAAYTGNVRGTDEVFTVVLPHRGPWVCQACTYYSSSCFSCLQSLISPWLKCTLECFCFTLILTDCPMPFSCLTATSWTFGMLAFAFLGLLIGAMLLVMGMMANRLVMSNTMG